MRSVWWICILQNDSFATDLKKLFTPRLRRYDVRRPGHAGRAHGDHPIRALRHAAGRAGGLGSDYPGYVGQHRRRSHRAQGVLREACNASDLRPSNPHATLTRIYTITRSSMTSLRLPTAPHMAHASSKPRQMPQRPATAPHEPQSALSRH